MRRSEKVAVTLDKKLVLVALTKAERRAVAASAKLAGTTIGRHIAAIVRAASGSQEPRLSAKAAGLTLTAYVRDVTLHAVWAPGVWHLSQDRLTATRYVERVEHARS